MEKLRSDSPICRRVVRAFVDFLNSVQPVPGVDFEGLDVARECLEEVFKLNSYSSDDGIQPGMLIDLFSSMENGSQCKEKSKLGPPATCTTSYSQQVQESADFNASNIEDQVRGPHVLGDFKDELFGKFCAALDKVNFFKISPDGVEDPVQVAKATKLFSDALMEMENAEGQTISLSNLAEMFKLRGNRCMQSKSYSEAIELYTCAIVLCERNAVYYCNRAAGYTQIHNYAEAIHDCVKSIEINPSYSKAYSRLGLAYYAQGNYSDALNKGFLKALQLDPNNDSVKDNIRVAQQKLAEQHQRAEHSQNFRSDQAQRSSAQSGGSTNGGIHFSSFSFDSSAPSEYPDLFESVWSAAGRNNSNSTFYFNPPTPTPPTPPTPSTPSAPPEFANMFRAATQAAASAPTDVAEVLRTMASTAQGNQTDGRRPSGVSEGRDGPAQGNQTDGRRPSVPQTDGRRPSGVSEGRDGPAQGNQTDGRRPSGVSEGRDGPDVRMGENTSFSFGEAPQQVSDVVRSVMGMFTAPHGSQQDMHRGGNGA